MKLKDVVYRIKNASLIPDNYGHTLEVKMVSAYTTKGKFIKNIKLDEKALDVIKNSWLIYNKVEE